jgi:serine/threonine protein kinase
MLSTTIGHSTLAKVGDFGLSRLMGPVLAGGEFNQNWLAPEVMKQEQYTEKIDVYSYGIILNELASLVKPFAEYDDQFAGKPRNYFRDAVIQGLRPTICGTIAHEFRALIEDCWQPAPEKRPSFGEIVQRLVAYMVSIGIAATEQADDEDDDCYDDDDDDRVAIDDEQYYNSSSMHISIPSHGAPSSGAIALNKPLSPRLDLSLDASPRTSTEGEDVNLRNSSGRVRGHRRRPSSLGGEPIHPLVRLSTNLTPAHPHTIQSLLLVEDLVWAGCRNGTVRLWNFTVCCITRLIAADSHSVLHDLRLD